MDASEENSDLKLSAIVALDSDTLLVQERTDNLVIDFEVDEAANILKYGISCNHTIARELYGAGKMQRLKR